MPVMPSRRGPAAEHGRRSISDLSMGRGEAVLRLRPDQKDGGSDLQMQ